MSDQKDSKNSKDVPAWKNFVIGTLALPDLVSSTPVIPLPQQPDLVQHNHGQTVQQVTAAPRRDLFQIDQHLSDLSEFQDLQNEQRRALQSELGSALRKPHQAQERSRTRDER